MSINKPKFEMALLEVGMQQGQRSGNSQFDHTDGDIVACAMVMSTLIALREMARLKVLGAKDIQFVIDGFMSTCGMVEIEDGMGNVCYDRKVIREKKD